MILEFVVYSPMAGILITIVGRDRPGLLAKISTVIADLGGNILDIKGHVISVEEGIRIANITLYIEGPEIPEFYKRIRNVLDELATELEVKIYVDYVANL